MTFDLPMPPSVNAMFATDFRTKRRFATKPYTEWQRTARDVLAAQYAAYGSPTVHRPVHVTLRVGLNFTGDIMNREKAVTDLLVDVIDMPDDRYIDRYVVERDRTVDGARVTIEGSALPDTFQSFGDLSKSIVARCAGGAE